MLGENLRYLVHVQCSHLTQSFMLRHRSAMSVYRKWWAWLKVKESTNYNDVRYQIYDFIFKQLQSRLTMRWNQLFLA